MGLQSVLIAFNPLAAAAATPTISNIANHLVISQIYTDGVLNQEFVELYNPTASDISLAGYDLATFNDPSDLTNSTKFAITQTQPTVKAGGYYLIASTAATPSVTPDATYDSASFDLDLNDSVALVSGSTIVDYAGWALADKEFCEGYDATAPAVSTCINDAVVISPVFVRLPANGEGNGIDTDNNKNDFITIESTATAPRNTATAPVFAAAPVVNSVSPADGSFINTAAVTVTANITESHFASAALTIDGTPITFTTYAANVVTFATTNLTDQLHTATLTITDAAGFNTSKTWAFTVDTTKPTLTVENQKTEVTATAAYANLRLHYSDTLSGVTEMRLTTDGTFDTEVWLPIAEIVRIQLSTKDGAQTILVQVRDRASNESLIASASSQISAPSISAPEYALSSTIGNTVTITWPAVPNATAYIVRYSDGQTFYAPITTTSTAAIIRGLDMSKAYHFEVAAVSAYGTISGFTKVFTPEQSPAKDKFTPAVATTTPTVTNAMSESTVVTGGITQRTAPTATVAEVPETTVSPAPTPAVSATPSGEIKSDTDDRNIDWTKIIVALSILIIAAGVATGGWYLYQWWTSQPKDGDKNKKGGRW
jgi:hypothetical protein